MTAEKNRAGLSSAEQLAAIGFNQVLMFGCDFGAAQVATLHGRAWTHKASKRIQIGRTGWWISNGVAVRFGFV